jgi:transglutaminase-like putative cysteine protease
VIYDVTHVTRYTYGAIAELTNGILRLIPVSRDGQMLERFDLLTRPLCLPPTERIDPFGNRVLSLRIEKPHRELSITAASRVRVDRPAAPEESPPWEPVAAEALSVDFLAPDCPAIALYPSRRIALFNEATAYARKSFADGRPIHAAALELASRIRSDFVYDPEATEVSTPAPVAFEQRRGVCQDFANIMIAALRGLGLPALYVSGYIRTIPPPGKERLAGADASHAWVSLWCGSALGWLDFDPTNALSVQNDHIEIARGRDYSEASPIESMVLSSGSHRLEVTVDVVPAPVDADAR